MTARQIKFLILGAVTVAAVAAVAVHAPIAQDPGYHSFADQRTIWGVPNFWNVMSNLPFLIAGWMGLAAVRRNSPGMLMAMRTAYSLFFAGAMLVAFGSGYYHLNPGNQSLVWDRLPMTVAFMAFFSIIVGEHIDVRLARTLLYPLLACGVFAVVYWHMTEQAGAGDLRLYVIAQFLPILLIPLIIVLFPSRLPQVWLIWGVLVAYVLAKLLELGDGWVYSQLDAISGHSIKHVAAALGVFMFYLAVVRRRPAVSAEDARPESQPPSL